VRRRLVPVAALALLAALPLRSLPADRNVAQYVRRSWTVERGLPHGTVRAVAQTADGYLWLATYEGLVRFNGEAFRVFDKNSGLGSSSIDTLCRTPDDSLWLGTFDGLVRYKDGRFQTIPMESDAGIIKTIVPSHDGGVWVGSAKGRIIHVAGEHPRALTLPLPVSPINALAVTGDVLWIGTSRGLFRYENGKLDAISSDSIVSLASDGDDALLIGTATGLDRRTSSGVEHIAGLPSDQITAVRRDRDGNLWIGTYGNGVFRWSNGKISPYGIADGLLNPTIRAIFEDDEGSIWIGSQNGLEQLRVGPFVTWNERDGLADDHVRTVFEDRDGVMWVGTATTLNRWDGSKWVNVEDSRLSRILAIEEGRDGTHWFGTTSGLFRVRGSETTLISTEQGLSNNSIRDIHEDRRGNVWVATDFGLNRIRPDGTIESFAGRGGLGAEYVMGITETPDGEIWVATGGGLGEMQMADGGSPMANGQSPSAIRNPPSTFRLYSAPRVLPSNRLFGIESDDDGTIWIATEANGVIRFRNGRAKAITTAQGLPVDKILSLVDDKRGNLWFGTVRGAFVASRYELNAIADGSSARLHTTFFDENDGLGSRQCNGAANPSAFRSRDGRIWFVTANGVSAYTNAHAPLLPDRAPIVERVAINGKDAPMASLLSIPGADRIEFEFSGVTFTTPERLHFRYRLDGYDEEWIDAGSSRLASYTNLPAGDYRFDLSSSRDGAAWHTSSLPLTLKPRFYETKWFIALCVFAVLLLLLTAHTIRMHLTHERARLLERLVEERTHQISEEKERTEIALREAERHEQIAEQALAQAEEANRAKSIFLAATSHELRTPLNAIIGFSEILITRVSRELDSRHARFLHNIHSSGEYLLGIINNILDLSKIEAGRMEIQPEKILLRDMINGICAVMKGVTVMKTIQIDIDMPDDLPLLEADSTLVKQILYNLMSNAVKFSPERSTVTVAARVLFADASPLEEKTIEIRVRDRGIGIDAHDQQIIFEEFRQATGGKRQGTGLGLALVKRFVELHRGTIRVESEPGQGSTFTVLLPVTQQRAEAEHLRAV